MTVDSTNATHTHAHTHTYICICIYIYIYIYTAFNISCFLLPAIKLRQYIPSIKYYLLYLKPLFYNGPHILFITYTNTHNPGHAYYYIPSFFLSTILYYYQYENSNSNQINIYYIIHIITFIIHITHTIYNSQNFIDNIFHKFISIIYK